MLFRLSFSAWPAIPTTHRQASSAINGRLSSCRNFLPPSGRARDDDELELYLRPMPTPLRDFFALQMMPFSIDITMCYFLINTIFASYFYMLERADSPRFAEMTIDDCFPSR